MRKVQGDWMKRFVEGADRGQSMLFPECLDDWIDEDNPVRVIDIQLWLILGDGVNQAADLASGATSIPS